MLYLKHRKEGVISDVLVKRSESYVESAIKTIKL